MKYYEMVEPLSGEDFTPVFNILSGEEIINSSYGDYCCLMFLSRLNRMPTRQDIIDEWCVVHWARRNIE